MPSRLLVLAKILSKTCACGLADYTFGRVFGIFCRIAFMSFLKILNYKKAAITAQTLVLKKSMRREEIAAEDSYE
jgi:hypothetical protein